MSYYLQSDEPATERLFLITKQHDQSSDFGHIQATVVRRAQPHTTNPDTGITTYGDEARATGYRMAYFSSSKDKTTNSQSSKCGHLVDHLTIRCQLSLRDYQSGQHYPEPKPYGAQTTFHDVYSIDHKMAMQIADTFKHLEKELAKISAIHGHPNSDDFAANVRRAALVLGIKRYIVVSPKSNTRNPSLASTDQWREAPILDLGYTIDQIVESFKPV